MAKLILFSIEQIAFIHCSVVAAVFSAVCTSVPTKVIFIKSCGGLFFIQQNLKIVLVLGRLGSLEFVNFLYYNLSITFSVYVVLACYHGCWL